MLHAVQFQKVRPNRGNINAIIRQSVLKVFSSRSKYSEVQHFGCCHRDSAEQILCTNGCLDFVLFLSEFFLPSLAENKSNRFSWYLQTQRPRTRGPQPRVVYIVKVVLTHNSALNENRHFSQFTAEPETCEPAVEPLMQVRMPCR